MPDYCWFIDSSYSFALKMEVIFSTETSVDSQRTTLRCIPEDSTLRVPLLRNVFIHFSGTVQPVASVILLGLSFVL
jgi:hypothetical protein